MLKVVNFIEIFSINVFKIVIDFNSLEQFLVVKHFSRLSKRSNLQWEYIHKKEFIQYILILNKHNNIWTDLSFKIAVLEKYMSVTLVLPPKSILKSIYRSIWQ